MIKTKQVAAIYARQSSGEETESASVEMQINICKEIADKTGYEVIAIESDLNISGRTYPFTDSAVSFSKMDIVYQNYIKNESQRKRYRKGLGKIFSILDKIDILIVYDPTRLMRPLTDSFLESFVKQNFISKGVKLRTKDSLIGFEDFSANIVNSLENRINDNQIKLAKQKSQEALRKLQDEGYAINSPSCLGFRSSGRQKVEIIENEMQVVRIIFEDMAKRKPLIDIIRRVNSLPNIHRKYIYSDIYKICNRLAYCGLTTNTKGEIIKSKVYPKIIPFELFREVQERLNDKKIKNRDKNKIHPLSGLVYCGYCGKRMIICKTQPFANSREKDPIYYYVCMDDYHKKSISELCKLATVREFYYFDDKNGIKEVVLPLLINEIKEEIKQRTTQKVDTDSLHVELAKIERLEKILDAKLVDGDMTESEYEKRFSEYRQRKKEIKAELLNSNDSSVPLLENALKTLCLYISVTNHIKDDFYKYLATKYVKKILVYHESVVVEMISGFTVEIERIRNNNSRSLPIYSLSKTDDKFEVVYFYKTAEKDPTESTIAETENIKVVSIGKNPKPFEYIQKRCQHKRLSRSKKYQALTKL